MIDESKLVKCSQCGDYHDIEKAEVSFSLPDEYFMLDEDEKNSRGKADSNFCQLDNRFFVRSVVPIPVLDRDDFYCWGAWSEVMKDDFKMIIDTWEDVDVSNYSAISADLANEVPEYQNSIGLSGDLILKSETRPFFYIKQESRFKSDQLSGITVEDIIRYYHYIRN